MAALSSWSTGGIKMENIVSDTVKNSLEGILAITTLGQAIQSTGLVEGDFDSLNSRGDNTRIFNMSKAHPAHNTYAQYLPKQFPGLASPSVIKQTYSSIKKSSDTLFKLEGSYSSSHGLRHSSETKGSSRSSRTISHALHSSLLKRAA